MRHPKAMFVTALGGVALMASTSMAGFAGQPILGPITLGSVVAGDNTGHGNENDGWFSGDHIFDLWDGGDDVWQLNWPGGDLVVNMNYNTADGDPDLFLYIPSNLDESAVDSYTNTGLDTVTLAAAPAGVYYVLVDSSAGAEGPYSLAVVPAPGAAGVLGLAGLAAMRRRR